MKLRPTRPALRYHGGKWRLADWIISHFPPHICYSDTYGGGASVLLQKARSELEVYNDKSQRVVSFFRVLREQPDALIEAIALTPYARAEFLAAREPSDDPVEAARRLFVSSWQGRGGPTARWNTGWRFQRSDNRGGRNTDDFSNTDHLYAVAARLKEVQIECDDALAVIARYDTPDTLHYIDPPYLAETRSKWGAKNGAAYDHELTVDDHRQLAAALQTIQGMAIVSGYPSPLYDELYADWSRVTCQAINDAATPATECLWLSPLTVARLDSYGPLFDQEVV